MSTNGTNWKYHSILEDGTKLIIPEDERKMLFDLDNFMNKSESIKSSSLKKSESRKSSSLKKSNSNTRKKKRCPNGTRRNSNGECVVYKSPPTPRTKYAKTYHSEPVVLVGDRHLIQFRINNIEQFTKYKKITKYTKVECFIQTLFALGLRNRDEGTSDVSNMRKILREKKTEGKELNGVWWTEAEKFIENAFDLPKNSIKHKHQKTLSTGVDVKTKEQQNKLLNWLSGFLSRNLEINCATIITIDFKKKLETWGHYIIAYNYNNEITYFCPQSKKKYIHLKNMTRSHIKWLITGYGYYSRFDFFDSDNIFDDDIPIQNSTCPIKFGTPTSRG